MAKRRIWKNKPPEVRERLRAERAKRKEDQKPDPANPEILAAYEKLSPTMKSVVDNIRANTGMSMERIIVDGLGG